MSWRLKGSGFSEGPVLPFLHMLVHEPNHQACNLAACEIVAQSREREGRKRRDGRREEGWERGKQIGEGGGRFPNLQGLCNCAKAVTQCMGRIFPLSSLLCLSLSRSLDNTVADAVTCS